MLKYAFSTNAFRKFTLPEAIRTIARCGYEGVEILADIPHAYPPETSEDDIAGILDVLEETSLQPANVNAFMLYAIQDEIQHPSWIEPDPEFRRKRVQHTIDCLKLAAKIGAPSIQTQPGGPLPPSMSRDEALKIFIRGIREVIPVAEGVGVDLLIEPEPHLLIENSSQVDELFSHVESSALGLKFDIGHFYCVGEDVPAAVRRFAEKIRHVHIEDIPADRTHYHLVPGEGAIDFDPIIEMLQTVGYDGFVTVELYMHQDDPEQAARKALDYLTNR
jgi:sugar phosphate isomerase/epimerase